MLNNLRYLLLVLVFFVSTTTVRIFGQSCVPTGIEGSTFNVLCNQTSISLNFRIPDLKQTTEYLIDSAATFNFYPWVTATATQDPNLYDDDEFSFTQNLPFSFCFFGSLYDQVVVGSNGLITFDPANGSCSNAYTIDAPIPFAGGNICSQFSTYYPRASIMAAYSDLDPRLNASPSDRKIQWEVVGTFPCRKFIVSYFHVGVFGVTSTTCGSPNWNTFQMVLHESTGLIDINILSKTCNSSSSAGRTILGIQNWDRNQAVAATGRNNTVWSASNKTFRFIPSGGSSRFVKSELYDQTGTTFLGLATSVPSVTVPGLLDITFPAITPGTGSTNYLVKTYYQSCVTGQPDLVLSEMVTVNNNSSLNVTHTSNNPSCGSNNGSITISSVAGGTPPYSYSIDNGVSWQTTNTFTSLSANTYTVLIKDATSLCNTSVQFPLVNTGTLADNITASPTSCAGVANGAINVNSVGGTGPYSILLNGNLFQSGITSFPHVINGLTANTSYTIQVRDANSCLTQLRNFIIPQGTGINASATTPTPTSCPTVSNGSFTVNFNSGVSPYNITFDGVPLANPVAGNSYTFNGLSATTHTVIITDAVGCSRTLFVTVPPGPALTAALTQNATSCSGATNGTLTVTPLSGTAPFEFSIDGGAFVPGTAPYTFTGLSAGGHSVVVKDALGCTSNATALVVASGPAITTTASTTAALCNGGNTGTLTVVPPNVGAAPFEYSLDGTNWQTSNIFNGLTAGTYTVRFRESAGCTGSTSVNLTEPTALLLSASTVPVICNAQTNGLINLTSSGGVAPYQFSVDGGVTWQSSSSFNVGAGNYTVTMKDANNCTITTTTTITEPTALTATALATNATCNGGNDGTITVTASGGNSSYSYSIDNGVNWQSTNSFSLAPGTYTVLIKDALNCTVSVNALVGLTNNLSFTPQADLTICESKSTQLNIVSNGLQYDWTPATGLSAVNIPNPVASPTVTTQYIVNVTLGRCSAKDTVVVRVNAAPVPNAGPDIFICYGQTATLQGSGGTVYKWTPSTFLDNASSPNAISTPDADITYILSILSDANGCAGLASDSVHIDVTPPMQVSTYPADTIGYPGDQFQLLAVPSDPDATNFVWTPSVGLSSAQIPNPVVTVGAIGSDVRYKVVASTIAGCKGEAYVNVRVYKGPDIYVPTGFTPNGDGKNDKFTPFPVGMKSYNYFRVFNRWGQVVFQTKKLNDGWDGTIGGQLQPDGIYVWMIEGLTKDDRIITKKGTVMLIK